MNIPFSPPDINEEDIASVVEALRSGWITTGPKTKEFEKQIAQYCGTSKAVCLNSATAASELSLIALGIGPGDEVITSAYTYTASASVIIHTGATPVILDVAPGSFFMDPQKIADAITPKTKAICPVDIGGVPCDYDAIYAAIESKKHLFVPNNAVQAAFGRPVIVADAAHSFGSTRGDKKSGNMADFTTFSFHAVKNLTTAEGGAVVWRDHQGLDNEKLYKDFMLLSLHGQSKDALSKTKLGAWEYDIVLPAFKCNMTDITAGLGLSQLGRYEKMLQTRRHIITRYQQGLGDILQFLPHYTDEYTSDGHLAITQVPNANANQRNQIIQEIAALNVATNVHYKPLPMHTAYQKIGFDIKDYPNAYAQFENEITLPVFSAMTDPMIDFVIAAVRAAIAKVM